MSLSILLASWMNLFMTLWSQMGWVGAGRAGSKDAHTNRNRISPAREKDGEAVVRKWRQGITEQRQNDRTTEQNNRIPE